MEDKLLITRSVDIKQTNPDFCIMEKFCTCGLLNKMRLSGLLRHRRKSNIYFLFLLLSFKSELLIFFLVYTHTYTYKTVLDLEKVTFRVLSRT